MDKRFGWWVDLSKVTLSDDITWVHALPFGTYQHPLYGEMNFDAPKLTNLANSVKQQVRGIVPDIDYDHKEDPAKGHQAAGWAKDADVRGDGLWLGVAFTADARQAIKEEKYKYFSAEFDDEWTDPQGQKHQDVLFGGGLTNRPFMKNLMPVNLSELFPITPPEVDEVDPKKLRESLGLPESTSDEDVFKKLGELGTALSTVATLTAEKTKLDAEIAALKNPQPDTLDPELKKLIEGSPAFKAMYEQMQAKDQKLAELAAGIRLADTEKKLTELQASKDFALAPTVREEVKEILLKSDPDAANKLFELFKKVVDGSAVVDLTEKGYVGGRRDAGDPTLRLNEAVAKLMEADKNLDYGTAVEQVTRMNPRLFEEYRNDNYSFRA
jgi:phage I-like protein